MRVQTALLLLVASASALPHPTNVSICDVADFSDATTETAAAEWEMLGADSYLRKDLMKNGPMNWTDHLFKDSRIDGSKTSTVCDFKRIGKPPICGEPLDCEEYKLPAARYIHVSMINLHGFLERLHEELQDIAIKELSRGIKDIKDTFGPPPLDGGGIFTVIIGILIMGVGFAGAATEIAAPLVAIAGVFNIAAGVYSDTKEDKAGLEDTLKATFEKIFSEFTLAVKSANKMFFSGDFSDKINAKNLIDEALDSGVSMGNSVDKWMKNVDTNGKNLIADTFVNGSWVDSAKVNKAGDKYLETVPSTINTALVVQALKANEYYLQRVTNIDEDECKKKNGLFFDGYCNRIGYIKHPGSGYTKSSGVNSVMKGMSDKMFKSFTKDYKLDYKETMKNAIECDEGKPDRDDWIKFNDPNHLPKCFANFNITKVDRSKCHGKLVPCIGFE